MSKGKPSGNRRGVKLNLLGQKFGRWTVISEAGLRPGSRQKNWNCVCICGNTKKVPTSSLTTGQSLSCGCLVVDMKSKHYTPEQKRKYQADWAKAKRAKRPANSVNNKINHYMKRPTPCWLTEYDWRVMDAFYHLAKYLTKQTGIRYEVDHIIPLQGKFVSGLHVPDNLQIITKSANSAKRNRYADHLGD